MASILIVGAFPPPVGGNSVHIQRLHSMLVQDGHKCKVIDLYGRRDDSAPSSDDVIRVGGGNIIRLIKTFYFLASLRYDIVHFHVSSMKRYLYVGLLYFIFIRSCTVKVLTIHSGSFPHFLNTLGFFKRKILKCIVDRFDCVIAVSSEIRQSLLRIGAKGESLYVIPAFLYPISAPVKDIDDVVSTSLSENRKIVVTSGSATKIYQYEVIIDAIAKSINNSVFLVICIYNEFDYDYFINIEERLRSSIEKYIIFKNIDERNFAYILERSNIYVRATTHDGDCVAIREANYFGNHVVASDCIERPDFCVCFETSNSTSLVSALNAVLKRDQNAYIASVAEGKNYYKQILSVYGM